MLLKAKDGIRGKLIDLDTGKCLKRVLWVDLDSGHFEAYQTDERGEIKRDQHGNYLTVQGIGRFRFEPANPSHAMKLLEGAPNCTKCRSPLTLPGDDLCARCRAGQVPTKQARTDGKARNIFSRERIRAISINVKCAHPGCGRVATWMTSDEAPASYVKGKLFGKVAWFARGMTVACRNWCDFHVKPPRLLDSKGEVIEELEGTGPDFRKVGVR